MIANILDFILLFLATFRLTRLLVYDKITNFIRRPFHNEYEETLEDGTVETFIEIKGTGLRKFIGELLSCYWCTGLWCAIVLYACYLFVPFYINPIIIVLAIAGCAALLEAILQRILA
ncbi:DUF1360 domain-containing protein [Bacillus sp. Marseille-P3661]|uniref:DUF1360 domain-containing protein n=1 Tax=Bacillus sp. Marseille-P3661 TaxID=1936234 RepID=UPI000C81E7A4|nr:DUF1360 domain-containing protein [Bacillus sp. Marseille-P3661]